MLHPSQCHPSLTFNPSTMPFLRSYYLFVCLLLSPLLAGAQTHPDVTKLFERFKSAAAFDHEFPREKVFLHLDNNAYFEGDSLFYKAYVVRASSLKPTDISGVLYVELLNAAGQMMERQLVKIDSLGGGSGCIKFDTYMHSGYYEVRAYTRAMLNWGENAYFSRVIPLFERTKESFSVQTIDEAWKVPEKAKRPFTFDGDSKRKVSFYPEGGARIEGLAGRIAFQVTDGNGMPCDDEVMIYDNEGNLLLSARPLHEGRGTFLLPEGVKGGYALVGDQRSELPEAQKEGYTLRADLADGYLDLHVARSSGMPQEVIGMGIFNRERACYFDTLHVNEPAEFSLPANVLRGGVNRIQLFDKQGTALAERLIYYPVATTDVQLSVRQSASTYAPYAPIALEFYVTDAQGAPIDANLSVAVRDDAQEVVSNRTAAIDAEMLLASEVRGYIHQPDFYFAPGDTVASLRKRRMALDHLLLVQGWTAASFVQMCYHDLFETEHPIEENLVLNGTVFKDNNKHEPWPNLGLKLLMYAPDGTSVEGECLTDDEGKFAFRSTVDYVGELSAMVYTEDAEKNRKWARVAFDRWFDPLPRTYHPQQQTYAPAIPLDTTEQVTNQPDVFEWTDTLDDWRDTYLDEAVVKAKRKYRPLQGNRHKWGGGEEKGKRNADNFYNVELELERWRDLGNDGTMLATTFIALLVDSTDYLSAGVDAAEQMFQQETTQEVVNPNEATTTEPETTDQEGSRTEEELQLINGKTTVWVLNNLSDEQNHLPTLMADEVQSVAVVTDVSKQKKFIGTTATEEHIDQVIVVYERPNAYLYKSKKGLTKRKVWGYAKPKAFYSPNYYEMKLPKKPDTRHTLYWTPQLTLDSRGKGTAVFFNNSFDGTRLRISVQGITRDGRFVSFER